MSIHQSNIAMLWVLSTTFRAKSAASHQFRMNGDLMGRMAVAFAEAADMLEKQETKYLEEQAKR